ncbi:glycosyl transferase group 1 [Caldithrix abyssi DSM 13497]|uniref:Glycosyl transferase group 1 n=1 Tax=Caldithrix abyssi DSM 13497 TaxID=880073 RepID=H1XRC3_CALAY|nr:glycosyltransferase [Caldithrix abyssi]APF18393.1 Glycosyltransferase involved in cell wall bisynthesis [Caldithrix abyssi DSM 13497]EHO42404.1 glycosyl transferase group 1 [Caldithrix abyssi DSM 13497]
MVKKLKILYIFTSGDFDSVNNKKWFDLFVGDPKLKILILIKDCDTEKKRKFKELYQNYFDVIYFKNLKELKKINYLQRYKYLQKISQQIDAFDPEIIHLHGLFYTYMAIPLFLLKNNPSIVLNIWGSDFNLAYRQKLKNKIILKKLMAKASLIWVNWYSMEEKIKKEFSKQADKIKTILWGVEDKLFQPPPANLREKIRKKFRIKPQEYIFLYTRGFVENSNHLNILKAIELLKTDKPVKFIFHNRNANANLESKIKEFIKANNLASKVLVSRQNLEYEEMRALYAESNVVLSLTSQEQLSRTTFEAILSDSNLIVHKNPSYRFLKDVFDFNIHLVDVHNITSIKETFEYFINQRPVPNWDFEKIVINRLFRFENKKEKYLQIYNDLIKSR